MVVAVNKWDLVTDRQRALKALRDTLGERLAQVPDVPLVTLSALSGRGLDRLELIDPTRKPDGYPPPRPRPTVYNETWELPARNIVLCATNS